MFVASYSLLLESWHQLTLELFFFGYSLRFESIHIWILELLIYFKDSLIQYENESGKKSMILLRLTCGWSSIANKSIEFILCSQRGKHIPFLKACVLDGIKIPTIIWNLIVIIQNKSICCIKSTSIGIIIFLNWGDLYTSRFHAWIQWETISNIKI